MKKYFVPSGSISLFVRFLLVCVGCLGGGLAHGQFISFNDNGPGIGTAPNTTRWDVFGIGAASTGYLKDINAGTNLPVTVTISRALGTGAVTASPSAGSPNPGTPLYNTFNGFVDFQGTGTSDASVQVTGNATVTYTFRGLNPNKFYSFKGSAVRAGTGQADYALRWSLFQLDGATQFISAHTAGAYTTGLAANQVAVNTGLNTAGDMADWENIAPGPTGSFAVSTTQYLGPIPGGLTATGQYCYAMSGFRLQELGGASFTNPPVLLGATNTGGNGVTTWFSLPLQATSATNVANYALTNLAGKVAVTGAVLSTNGQTVQLATANQTPYAAHWLRVKNVTDALTGTNAVATNTLVIFTNIPLIAPRLVSATNTGNNSVKVVFSQTVQPASATNAGNYVLTNIYGNVPVVAAAMAAGGQTVMLTTSSQTPYAAHWLTVNRVTDAATGTNAVAPNSLAIYTNIPFVTGFIERQLYLNLSGSQAVADLTNSPSFPNSPDLVDFLPTMGWPAANIYDNYGGRMAGILVPPVDGTYYLAVESDDNSQLFLSTDESLVNRVLISFEPNWGGSFDANTSTAITLKGGQHYYIEGLMKEGGGGDYFYVGWKTPTNASSWDIIPGTFLGNYFFGTNSTLTIVQQPTNTSVMAGQSATFSVSATGNSALTSMVSYQWQSNGFDIPGAISSNLVTGVVGATNSGVQYRVLVLIPGAALFSSNVTLTVTPDIVAPTVQQVQNFGTTNVLLGFSEPVEAASATNIANYAFTNGLPVTAAKLDPNTLVVTLTTGPLVYGSNYTLVINGVRDRAVAPNTILTNTLVNFLASAYARQDVGNPPVPSSVTVLTNGLSVTAVGSDIGGVADQFGFNYQLLTGDFDMSVRLASLSDPNPFAKAGLMARESMAPGSQFVAAFATPAMNGDSFMWRSPTGNTASSAGSFPPNFPNGWLRLKRTGNVFTGYASYDGQTWTQLGIASISMTNQVLFGMAVTSDNLAFGAQAVFQNLGTTGTNAVLGTFTNPHEILGPSARKTMISISEIMYKPAPRTDGKNLEFLEIYNSNPWFQDISGYQIAGGNINYTFPPGTVMQGGAFLVLAAVPADIASVYGITNVMGPYTGSLKKTGTISLLSEVGALELTVPYSNVQPWPVAAEGTGHSLVLAYPSYGEGDPRAWDISDVAGGSPGLPEAYRPNPLRSVVINELLPHSENAGVPQYVELYNHSNQSNDLSGCILTDDPTTNRFVIPAGTFVPPHGFVVFPSSQLGFALPGTGGTVFFIKPDGTRVLDALQYEPQADGVAVGRWPDGAGSFYQFTARTPGTNNSSVVIGDIVFNELMYNPISGNDADQYVELYNKGTNTVNLGGWQVKSGVTFTFPSNVVMTPGAYFVLAADQTNLWSKYPNLNSANTIGNWTGRLSHNGERVVLAMPQALYGTNTIYVAEDEVTYGTGGRWGAWSGGGGSSLELVDAHANHRLAANWGDSDETRKSAWVNIEATGVLDNGGNYDPTIDYAQIGILDVGECLVDNLEVHAGNAGTNYVANPTFENGLAYWTLQGDMSRSTLESTGYVSSRSLHIRCSDRMWTGDNSCEVALWPNSLGQGQTATLRFKARWLHGWPEVLFRLNGNWLEATGAMPVPANLGTPGLPNSIALTNVGPAIFEVTHTPSLPAASQAVVVTARIHDPDGVLSCNLYYRIDPATAYNSITMRDDGAGGDAVAGDGIFSATISGRAAGTLVAFYVSAMDAKGMTSRFPALVNDNAPVREGLILFGDGNPGGSFGVYHMWITQTNATRWSNLSDLSNESHDFTFVNGNRVIYNAQGRFAGSPYHQGFDTPYGNLCHYKWIFQDDDKFLGATSFNKIHQPGNGAGDDGSIQREQLAHTFMRALGVPWLNRRYVAVYVNGNRRGTLMEDTQCPDSDVVKEYFPNDTGGFLYKMQPWFEFGPAPSGISIAFNNNSWCELTPFTTTGGAKKVARYRYNFLMRRTPDSANNYTNIFSLVDAANAAGTPNFVANLESLADMENWMRVFAANHAAGNWDSFGAPNGQNLYGYIGAISAKYSLIMWDYNIVIGNGSWGPGQNLLSWDGGNTGLNNVYSNPEFLRMYWRALGELVVGPLSPANSGPLLDAKFNAFAANGISVENPSSAIKGWLSQAQSSIDSQRAGVDGSFFVSPTVTIANNVATVTGTAQLLVKHVLLNGVAWPLTWTSVTGWSVQVPLRPGTNVFSVVGVDRSGSPVAGASNTVAAVYKGAAVSPVGQIVINEIMALPAVPNADFIELFNRSTTNTFDLSGWQLNGLGYTFPPGATIGANSFLVLAANRTAFAAAYGATNLVFDTYPGSLQPGGETLTLIQPDAGGSLANGITVAKVRYATNLPWPTNVSGTGASLQLVDFRQDNWRVLNWRGAAATPGQANVGTATLFSFQPLWLNEIQPDNRTGITNWAGQRTAWLELFNPSSNSVSLSGLYLSANYSNLTAWTFPVGSSVPPGQFKVVFVDGQTNLSTATELHTSFLLPPGSGSLALSRLDSSQAHPLDYLDYSAVPINFSYGSVPDGQSFVRQYFYNATPGATNSTAPAPGSSVDYTDAGAVYSQTFDSLPNPGTSSVNSANPVTINGVTYSLANPFDFAAPALASGSMGGLGIASLAGWYGLANPATSVGTRFGATDGDQTTGGVLSFGLPGNNNRALGLLATSSTGYTSFGLKLINETGVALNYINLDVVGEVWRQSNLPKLLEFHYWVDPSGTNGFTTNATQYLRELDVRIPTLGAAVGGVAVDGTLAANQQKLGVLNQPIVSWLPGGALWLVWQMTDPTGKSQGLAIDNLNFSATSEPATVTGPTLTPRSIGPGGSLILTWPTLLARTYQMQFSTNLSQPNWIAVSSPQVGTGQPLSFTNSSSQALPAGFYRLQVVR